jgi:Flavin containing amine oxidoreductase
MGPNRLLYLAGEHLCFDFIGTINGAYITGIKAAERIIGDYVQYVFIIALVMCWMSGIQGIACFR